MAEYKVWQLIQERINNNVRIYPVMRHHFSTLAYAFFNDVELSWMDANGNVISDHTMDLKKIGSVENSLTIDGEYIKWYDFTMEIFKGTIDSDATVNPTGKIYTFTLKETPLLAEGDKVFLIKNISTWTEAEWIVTAVDVSAKTVGVYLEIVNGAIANGTSAITVKAWQFLDRGAWMRNDGEAITRTTENSKYNDFSSYIQNFSEKMTIKKSELNKVFTLEEDAKDYVNIKFAWHVLNLINGLSAQVYKWRNKSSGAQKFEKMQMLGLEETCRLAGTIKSLSWSSTMELDLRHEIHEAIRGASKMWIKKISLMLNTLFLTQLSELERDKIRYTNTVDKLSRDIPIYSTPYGDVELLADVKMDSLYPYSAAFTVPLEFVKIWIRENQSATPKGEITKVDQSIGIIQLPYVNPEMEQFDFFFEAGLIPVGMMSGAYRFIKDFKVV